MIRAALLAVAVAAVIALASPRTARADAARLPAPAPRAADETPAPSKKHARWAAKQEARDPLRTIDRAKLVGKPPAEVISIYNTWTHEWVAVDRATKELPPELVERLLRCHFTNEPTDVDPRLGGALLAAARHFKKDRVNIVSAYRAPKYNLILRKKGRNVARDSEHTKGHAVDFWLPGVATKALYQWALRNQFGGVGYYPNDGFVHVDVGRKRTWTGK